MKLFLVTLSLSILLFVGCNTDSKDQKESSSKAPDKSIEYLIQEKVVGEFKIGSPIYQAKNSDYKIEKRVEMVSAEGDVYEEIVYAVSRDGKEMLRIKLDGGEKGNINDIDVISDSFRTDKRIGINSTIEEFKREYPDFYIWYGYIGDTYVIESKKMNVQFILDSKDFIGKLNITGDMVILKDSDFKPGAKISRVRVL